MCKECFCWNFVVLHQAAAHLPTHDVLLPCCAPAITLQVQYLQVPGQASAKRPYASAIKKRLISVVETGSCGLSGGSSNSNLSGDGQEAGTAENWPGAAASSPGRWVGCERLSCDEQQGPKLRLPQLTPGGWAAYGLQPVLLCSTGGAVLTASLPNPQAEDLLTHILPCRALRGVRGSSMALPEALPAAAVGASLPGSSGTPLQGTPGGPVTGRPLRRLSNR